MGKTGDAIDRAIAKRKVVAYLKSSADNNYPDLDFRFKRKGRENAIAYRNITPYKKAIVRSMLNDQALEYVEKAINAMKKDILLHAAELAKVGAETAAAYAREEAKKILKILPE